MLGNVFMFQFPHLEKNRKTIYLRKVLLSNIWVNAYKALRKVHTISPYT